MEYTLKDKIQVNKDFLAELEIKSWQEIEHLQNQIANIEMTAESAELVKLLNSLLTSYYVFAGGLENLNDDTKVIKAADFTDKVCPDKELIPVGTKEEAVSNDSGLDEIDHFLNEPVKTETIDDAAFEPFEYFVDFDEPTGEPLTDDDIYNN
jgi:hypothetical protein